jgi:hypothetical protein
MTQSKGGIPQLLRVVSIPLTLLVCVSLYYQGDWRTLDDVYGYSGDFHGKCLSTRVSIWFETSRGGGHGGTAYDVCSNSEGFFFGTPLNIFGLKPIVVPWHDVSMHVEDRPAYQTVVLKFRLLPGYTFEFHKDIWDQLSVPKAELSPEP